MEYIAWYNANWLLSALAYKTPAKLKEDNKIHRVS